MGSTQDAQPTKAARYRHEAARAVDLADQTRDGEARVQLLHIARVYRLLAANAERLAPREKPADAASAEPAPDRSRASPPRSS